MNINSDINNINKENIQGETGGLWAKIKRISKLFKKNAIIHLISKW